MERDVDEVGKISRFIKGKIEELDREVRLRDEYIVVASVYFFFISIKDLRPYLMSSESGEPN